VVSDENGLPKGPGGINGGFSQRGTHGLTRTFIEIKVQSIDDYLKKIEKAGGTTVLSRSPISDFGFFAIIKDTEGNILGLWEDKKE
jgi:predicted enzyme related to lactoylglutathione lyase